MAKKTDVRIVYLLIVAVLILSAAVIYLVYFQPVEIPVVTTEEKAAEVQQDVGTSISDIRDDLEQLKKDLER